jgi:hypothetical protein
VHLRHVANLGYFVGRTDLLRVLQGVWIGHGMRHGGRHRVGHGVHLGNWHLGHLWHHVWHVGRAWHVLVLALWLSLFFQILLWVLVKNQLDELGQAFFALIFIVVDLVELHKLLLLLAHLLELLLELLLQLQLHLLVHPHLLDFVDEFLRVHDVLGEQLVLLHVRWLNALLLRLELGRCRLHPMVLLLGGGHVLLLQVLVLLVRLLLDVLHEEGGTHLLLRAKSWVLLVLRDEGATAHLVRVLQLLRWGELAGSGRLRRVVNVTQVPRPLQLLVAALLCLVTLLLVRLQHVHQHYLHVLIRLNRIHSVHLLIQFLQQLNRYLLIEFHNIYSAVWSLHQFRILVFQIDLDNFLQ